MNTILAFLLVPEQSVQPDAVGAQPSLETDIAQKVL
jgi:hypothetical protein